MHTLRMNKSSFYSYNFIFLTYYSLCIYIDYEIKLLFLSFSPKKNENRNLSEKKINVLIVLLT